MLIAVQIFISIQQLLDSFWWYFAIIISSYKFLAKLVFKWDVLLLITSWNLILSNHYNEILHRMTPKINQTVWNWLFRYHKMWNKHFQHKQHCIGSDRRAKIMISSFLFWLVNILRMAKKLAHITKIDCSFAFLTRLIVSQNVNRIKFTCATTSKSIICFVRFVLYFSVDGNYPTMIVLLIKACNIPWILTGLWRLFLFCTSITANGKIFICSWNRHWHSKYKSNRNNVN